MMLITSNPGPISVTAGSTATATLTVTSLTGAQGNPPGTTQVVYGPYNQVSVPFTMSLAVK